ncbi:MAG TPA: aminotransferase class V-fold PLP-dependent enzyme [Planctomycetes bacterium]|nr:aminotransferase class V-fold PLP-dependent enzyme [Planctomycetaceae bacterium]HIN95696.1 aminotransferase class V-fold PLP-dependent enzyme [Planctomycetota bacterium]
MTWLVAWLAAVYRMRVVGELPIKTSQGKLAFHGGDPVLPEGPPSWPATDPRIEAVLADAYADGSWGRYEGIHSQRLIESLSELHAVEHVSLCASGTIAVELALRGMQVATGDEVILAGYDFPGNFRAVEHVGARPVLVDIDPARWCLNVELLEQAISPQTRAVLVSHLHGGLAPMKQIMELAQRRGLQVVEDACQAPGAMVDGQVAGSHGDVGVLSFGGSKLLTSGRGGAVLTSQVEVHQRIKVFCERGNHAFPLSELQAAVLYPQLQGLAVANRLRCQRVSRLLAGTEHLTALRPVQSSLLVQAGEASAASDASAMSSFYKLAWSYDLNQVANVPRDQFLAAVQAEGVALDAGFRGFVKRSARRCRVAGELTESARAAEATVILHHPVLIESVETVDRVAMALEKVVLQLSCS